MNCKFWNCLIQLSNGDFLFRIMPAASSNSEFVILEFPTPNLGQGVRTYVTLAVSLSASHLTILNNK